jgi:hypothetical protein
VANANRTVVASAMRCMMVQQAVKREVLLDEISASDWTWCPSRSRRLDALDCARDRLGVALENHCAVR